MATQPTPSSARPRLPPTLTLPASYSSHTSPPGSPLTLTSSIPYSSSNPASALGDESLAKEIEALQDLATSLRTNLKLRPLRSPSPSPGIGQGNGNGEVRRASEPALATPGPSSSRLTPTLRGEARGGARTVQRGDDAAAATPPLSVSSSASGARAVPTPHSQSHSHWPPSSSSTPTLAPRSFSLSHPSPSTMPVPTSTMNTSNSPTYFPRGLSAPSLLAHLSSPNRPLILDTRPLPAFLRTRLSPSINLAIPSLILKRCSKPGAPGFNSLDALRGFVTTDAGREQWDDLIGGDWEGEGRSWNGDVVIYDEEMDERGQVGRGSSTAWTLSTILLPLVPGKVHYLLGGFATLRTSPDAQSWLMSGDDLSPSLASHPNANGSPSLGQDLTVSPGMDNTPQGTPGTSRSSGSGAGLFSLRTDVASRRRPVMVEVDPPSVSPPPGDTSSLTVPAIQDASPSPPPSAAFPRSPRRLNASRSSEHLAPGSPVPPRLQLRCTPLRASTMPVPPSPGLLRVVPPSPSHLHLTNSPLHSPLPSPSFRAPSPTQALPPPSPMTARPSPSTPPSDAAPPPFTISTILPSFLYLGPEPSTDEEVEQLRALGVKRILNMAEECDDDKGLALRKKFEMYERVPMRDTVEEENIGRGVRAACLFLDDARLHSSPTYVHCKAGKSRSVTVVMGYLIHANHWPLSRAYAFVMDRRRGISPNIGFVSELMKFEEQVLGSKSVGVGLKDGNGAMGMGQGQGQARRAGHVRESLPPLFSHASSLDVVPAGLGLPGIGVGMGMGSPKLNLGDSATETEVKDSSGRYVHARRVPVDDQTLQPQRRVSKAGLESTWA